MGRFVACAGYPECSYTRNVNETAEEAAERIAKAEAEQAELDGRECPNAADGWCTNTAAPAANSSAAPTIRSANTSNPWKNPKTPAWNARSAKKGIWSSANPATANCFNSCSTYPDCNYATWNPPLAEECPNCHWPVLTVKTTKRWGVEKVCPQKECGWKEQIEPPAPKE